MKISFIEPHLKIYGGIRRIIELANRLTERSNDVTIFHSNGSHCEWMRCIAKTKSRNEILNEQHDVVIYNDPNPIDYDLVRKVNAKLKVFYVLELYNKELLKKINLKLYLPRNKRMLILKKSLRSSYLKLVNATWEKVWLKENMNIDSQLLLGGVNFEMFHPVDIEKDRDRICILCSGDPRVRKGTKTILEAVEIVRREEPRIILDTYYGKGIPQEKMAETYSSADIFVEGSWHAGWNNPVVEAMACKVPVVCTDIDGVRDFAFHEKTALLVPPRNSEAMASAILRLIRDEKLRESLRESAYQHVRQFDWNESARKLEQILLFELMNAEFKGSYIGRRSDILNLIPSTVRKVLDIGCSTGEVGRQLKQRFGSEVIGVEIDEKMAEVAKKRIDRVIIGNIENISVTDQLPSKYFDCIILADVLEHLRDPCNVLKAVTRTLSNEGIVVASIPNVRHYTTITSLVFKGYWPYQERGIHDKNHLRFFTLRNIRDLFENAKLHIVRIERNYRIVEKPHWFNRFSKYFALPKIKEFLAFQYLIVAEKKADI
ncbi:MAG: glycosyltransferase [Deltaproteobacteria bacterium]|nr:glycosyltransferase [Deltaproteobacteria bacterium]MBW2126121.1 glycosyltransferase [Deltaproteobacteria bacterium]